MTHPRHFFLKVLFTKWGLVVNPFNFPFKVTEPQGIRCHCFHKICFPPTRNYFTTFPTWPVLGKQSFSFDLACEPLKKLEAKLDHFQKDLKHDRKNMFFFITLIQYLTKLLKFTNCFIIVLFCIDFMSVYTYCHSACHSTYD